MELFWIFPLFCLIFMIGMMFMMFRMFRHGCMAHGSRAGRGDEPETARQVIDRRYASGRIGRNEYEALKRDLKIIGETK